MIIGVPSEVKNNEFRVGLTPDSVKILTKAQHKVLVQANAGSSIGFTDELYIKSGATILNSAKEIYESSELIIKVKEPVEDEFQYLRKGLTLFTYLHLAGDLPHAKKLLETNRVFLQVEILNDFLEINKILTKNKLKTKLPLFIAKYSK